MSQPITYTEIFVSSRFWEAEGSTDVFEMQTSAYLAILSYESISKPAEYYKFRILSENDIIIEIGETFLKFEERFSEY